ncbi:type 1 fimbrial protein [Pseudomonas mandelii]|uniref:type 1 fimbrial protein n=1 Tax=Pseudomonas mandelii TaxID=75612 RepID=UPI003C7893A4
MNGKRMSVCISLFFALNGTCLADTRTPGALQFHGSIVEQGCTSHANTHAKFELNGCPPLGRAAVINVSNIRPVSSVSSSGHSSINVKLLADSGQKDRYYDSQYELVDATDRPIRSGLYLITLSMP